MHSGRVLPDQHSLENQCIRSTVFPVVLNIFTLLYLGFRSRKRDFSISWLNSTIAKQILILTQTTWDLLDTASLESAQSLPSNEPFSPPMNIPQQLTLISSCGFTSHEQPFPSQKCNYSCRIQNVPPFIFSDQVKEDFGQSLQLLANYNFRFYFFNLAITQNVFLTFTEDINS